MGAGTTGAGAQLHSISTPNQVRNSVHRPGWEISATFKTSLAMHAQWYPIDPDRVYPQDVATS